jgi:hypothetical protein
MGLGSEIRPNLFRIPDPGVKRHRIPDPDPQNCSWIHFYNPERVGHAPNLLLAVPYA